MTCEVCGLNISIPDREKQSEMDGIYQTLIDIYKDEKINGETAYAALCSMVFMVAETEEDIDDVAKLVAEHFAGKAV